MTLIVYTFYIDTYSGKYIEEDLDLIEPGKEIAGFETWRTKVYNSPIIKRLGAKFLPTLANSDLWVENRDIEDFETEVRLLLDNVGNISYSVNYKYETIELRLNNILQAIVKAKQQNGGIEF